MTAEPAGVDYRPGNKKPRRSGVFIRVDPETYWATTLMALSPLGPRSVSNVTC